MQNTNFVVKVNHQGTGAPEYVQRIERTPVRTTTDPRLALLTGRFTAEEAVKSIQNSLCSPELLYVRDTPNLRQTLKEHGNADAHNASTHQARS